MTKITEAWDKGSPLARQQVYDMLQKEWPQPHVFHQQFLTPDKVSPRSQWLSRAIGRHGWVIRKSTVSQKVPDNWLEIGGLESVRICETFRLAEIDVLINADETFLRFYPEEEHVIAPEGSKRVGSTNETNDKKGLTAMLGVELFSSTVLPAFTVLDGATEGRLSKHWASYTGTTKVCFQKNHWMDKILAKKYLSWLKSLFPGKKIGLIWDKAAAHVSQEVLEHAKELGIVVELLYAGMTSIMQPCDIWLNRAFKKYLQDKYYEYKNSLHLQTGQKVNVPREQIISWVEEAIQHHNAKQKQTRKVAQIFAKCGLDPFDMEKGAFKAHLETLKEDSIYNSLVKNQQACELTF